MIEVERIEKSYCRRRILSQVSFQAGPGECVGILGGNGCGKTTLLSIIAGVYKPDRGYIWIDGQNALKKRKLFYEKIAYVPQENPLIPELTAMDNYRLWFRGSKEMMRQDLESGIGKILGIDYFLKTEARRLSGGEKKRLSIAAALSGQAKILVMDEPGAALDLAAKEQILCYVKNYVKTGGTVILTSHEMEEIRQCTKLYVLKNGVLEMVPVGLEAVELTRRF